MMQIEVLEEALGERILLAHQVDFIKSILYNYKKAKRNLQRLHEL